MTSSKDNHADEVERNLEGWREILPAELLPAFEAAVRIERLSLRGRREISELAPNFGVGPGDADLLGVLFEDGPPYALQSKQLAERCFVSTGAITGRLDRLESGGFVKRVRSSVDRRAINVELTKAGRAVALNMASTIARGRFNGAINGLSVAERDQLIALLKKVEGLLGES